MTTKKIVILSSTSALLVIISFFCGWVIRDRFFAKTYKASPLRVSGSEFTKPLLMCDTNPERKLPELKSLESDLNNFIVSQEAKKDVDSVSVYFQDLITDGRIDINKNEKFSPASLTKVPIMIAILKMTEADPDLLFGEVKYSGKINFNNGQEIQPKEYAKSGETYTVENLLEKMIKYSDNSSFQLLNNLISESQLKSFFNDLQVPFPINSNKPEEFNSMTTKDVSYFFRILYNATYLKNDLSNTALKILSQTDYKNGIVAGIPDNVKIAHKFGLETFTNFAGKTQNRELNDCGIVYHPTHPYMLCIMTKTSSSIQTTEGIIKNISSMIYNRVNNYSQKQN
jgi:beta-lactamase class A